MVRRRDRTLFSCRSSWARAKLSSLTKAGTGISIHSSRGRSWPAVMLGVITPRRRCGRMTRVREEARVLPKQATPRYAELRNTAQTVERSHRALALRVGMPSALIRRVISPMLRPSTVYNLIDALDHTGLGVKHGVRSRRLVGLADIAVPIRSAAHHADLTRLGPVSFTAARSLQNLGPLILSYHPLELYK